MKGKQRKETKLTFYKNTVGHNELGLNPIEERHLGIVKYIQ